MVHAWEASTVIAVVSGVVGFFIVMRGSAFAAHALPNGAFAGAAAASLVGASTLLGLGVFSIGGALGIAALGRRARHDVATALVVVLMLALGALFLSLGSAYAPEVYGLLFGEILGVSGAQLLPTVGLGLVALAAVAVLYRPLLLSSISPDVGHARGLRPAVVEAAFLVVVALATTMAVPVVGALLVFTLLIGPPAAARSFTDRPERALLLGAALALALVWASVAASYTTDRPIGFYVGTGSAALYTVGRVKAAATGA